MIRSTNKKPIRSCIACGRSDAKNGLMRFVRSKDGEVSYDASGRKAGRGAYLCADDACFMKAAKQGSFSRALRCQLSTEDYLRLEAAFNNNRQQALAK